MEFVLLILILLLVWFFMISPFMKIYKATKQWRDTFINNTTGRQQQQNQRRRRSEPAPAPRKKKIDPAVGEYVEFTETTIITDDSAANRSTANRTRVERESQVTDVKWEDID